jgi:hypothetical protein
MSKIRIALAVEYAGYVSVASGTGGKSFEGVVKYDGAKYSKYFGHRQYGGSVPARQAAEKWRQQQSDELELTVAVYPSNIAMAMRKYIAGLVDGDGSIAVYKRCAVLRVNQSQDTGLPEVLKILQQIYGGEITTVDTGNPKWKLAHCLALYGLRCLPILHDIIPYLILKREQATIVYNWLIKRNIVTREETDTIQNRLVYLKGLASYQSIPVRKEQLSDEYATGLFDAEGHVMTAGVISLTLGFTQESSHELLDCLIQHFKVRGYRDGKQLRFHGDAACSVANLLIHHSVVKRSQLEAAIELRNLPARAWTSNELEYARLLQALISTEKHL